MKRNHIQPPFQWILTHQAAQPCYIRTEDKSRLAPEVLCVHGITSQTEKPPEGNRSPLEASLSIPSGGMLS
jgi:hypothetical protein